MGIDKPAGAHAAQGTGQGVDSASPTLRFGSEGAAYEVARDILTELVAIAAARLGAAATNASAAGTENWRERREEWLAQLEALRPEDTGAVSTVLRSHGPLLARLRAEAT